MFDSTPNFQSNKSSTLWTLYLDRDFIPLVYSTTPDKWPMPNYPECFLSDFSFLILSDMGNKSSNYYWINFDYWNSLNDYYLFPWLYVYPSLKTPNQIKNRSSYKKRFFYIYSKNYSFVKSMIGNFSFETVKVDFNL